MQAKKATSGGERGEAARHKLIEAALQIYSESGYEGASTRDLAKLAGVNIAAIPYYFGGKEGLYHAVIEHFMEHYRSGPGVHVEAMREKLARPDITQDECRALLNDFMRTLIRFILQDSKERSRMSRIMMREQLDPTPAFDLLYNGMIRDMHATLASLVGRLTGLDPSLPETKIVTQTIFGQITTFKCSRQTVLRNMGWKGFGEKEVETITQTVLAHTDAILNVYRK